MFNQLLIGHFNDYYKTQGLAFIMLVSSLIYRKLFNRIQNLNNKSVNDVLLDSRMLKINLRNKKPALHLWSKAG